MRHFSAIFRHIILMAIIFIAISGYQSLSQSPGLPGDTFFELAVIENSVFAVGILMISIILSEI